MSRSLPLRLSFAALVVLSISTSVPSQEREETRRLFEMSLEELMEVEITTAGKTSQRIGDIPASVVLITREEIERFGFTSVEEIIESVLGYYITNDYQYKQTGVRGFWTAEPNSKVLILVNGVAYRNRYLNATFFADFSVPVEAIDRIEIVRGPMSVMYGSGAFFGAVNIKTNDSSAGEPVSVIAASYGSANRSRLAARLAGTEGALAYFLTAGLSRSDGIDEPLAPMTSSLLSTWGRPQDDRTAGKLGDSGGYFNLHGLLDDLWFDVSYSNHSQGHYFLYPTWSDKNTVDRSFLRISAGYERALSEELILSIRGGYLRTDSNYTYSVLSPDFLGVQRVDLQGLDFDALIKYTRSGGLELVAGISYEGVFEAEDFIDAPWYGIDNLTRSTRRLSEGSFLSLCSAYSQVSYEAADWLLLVAGVRLEQMPSYDFDRTWAEGTPQRGAVSGRYESEPIAVIPQCAAILSLDENNRLKVLYGEATSRPGIVQNVSNYLSALPQVNTEWIRTFELNFVSTPVPNLLLSASYFHNRFDDLIVRSVELDLETDSYETFYSNAGKLVTDGLELLARFRPDDCSQVEFACSFQETRDRRPGMENISVAYSPNFLGYFKGYYRLTDRITVSLTGSYVSSMEARWDELVQSAGGSLGGRIGRRIDGRFNLGCNIRFEDLLCDGSFVSLRISNLLDERVRYPTTYNNEWADLGTIGWGRTWLLTAGTKF